MSGTTETPTTAHQPETVEEPDTRNPAQKALDWLKRRTTPPPRVRQENLGPLLQWVGGGFALLAAIATFFGIKDGVLSRVVRTQPTATLAVFVFVGIAVILALTIPAVGNADEAPEGKRGGPVWFLLLLGAGFVAATVVVSPDLPHPAQDGATAAESGSGLPGVIVQWWAWLVTNLGPPGLATCGLLLLASVLFFLPRTVRIVSWPVFLLVLAVLSLGCGLYTASKLSVLEKVRLEGAVVASTIQTVDGQTTVSLSATGTDLAGPVRVRVVGLTTPDAKEQPLTEQVLMPSRSGTLDASAAIPIKGTFWDEIRVLTCQEWNTTLLKPCVPNVQQASFKFVRQAPAISAQIHVSDDKTSVLLTLAGTGIPAGGTVTVTAERSDQKAPVAKGLVQAGTDGTVAWAAEAATGKAATWKVLATTCEPASNAASVCKVVRELARLQVAP